MSHHLWLFVLKSILTYFGGQPTGDRGTLKLILLSSDWKLVSGEVTWPCDSQQMMTRAGNEGPRIFHNHGEGRYAKRAFKHSK